MNNAQPRKVLLADDIDMNRYIYQTLLTSIGLQVDAVPNGSLAIEALKKNHYDLILMDIEMPGIDGLSACTAIRRMDTPKSTTPIVALSGHNTLNDRRKSIDAGMDDHIGRPISPANFAEKVKRLLLDCKCSPPSLRKLRTKIMV